MRSLRMRWVSMWLRCDKMFFLFFKEVVKNLFYDWNYWSPLLGMVKIFIPEIDSWIDVIIMVKIFIPEIDSWIDVMEKKSNFSIFRNVEISYLPGSGTGPGVEGDGWKYGCVGVGVAAAVRRVWPCGPRSTRQNGRFWKGSDVTDLWEQQWMHWKDSDNLSCLHSKNRLFVNHFVFDISGTVFWFSHLRCIMSLMIPMCIPSVQTWLYRWYQSTFGSCIIMDE